MIYTKVCGIERMARFLAALSHIRQEVSSGPFTLYVFATWGYALYLVVCTRNVKRINVSPDLDTW